MRAIILDRHGRVLLVRRTYTTGWFLRGGGVARGESVTDGLRRELREEVGVEPTGTPRILGMYSSTAEGKSDHIGVFVVEEWRRRPAQCAEVIEADFFAPDRLPPQTSPATRRRIAEHRGQRPIDYEW